MINLKQVTWHIRRLASLFGWPGAAVVFGSLICVMFVLLVLQPLGERLGILHKEAASLQLQTKPQFNSQKRLNPVDQLDQFYRFFPRQDAIAERMAKLYGAAAQHNLNLEQGEYRLIPVRESKLARYEIVLPIKGGYLQLRKFVAQVLTEVPNLSLDAITFSRQKIEDSSIDVQLNMTFYLRQE